MTPAEPVAVLSPSKGAAPSIPVPLVGARLTREELDAWYRTALLSALCFAFVVSLLSKLRVSLLGSRKRYQLVIKRWNEEDDNLHSGNRNGRGLLGNHTLIHEVTKSFNSCIVKPEVEGAEVELRVAPLLDAMGKSMRIREIFGPLMSLAVKNDEGNLGKVHKVWSKMRDVDKKRPTTLRGLLEVEKAAGIHRPGGHLADPSAAIALLWMRRTLMFSIAVLQGACEKDAHLGNLARAAYTSQLEQYHGWLLKNTFTMALSAMPSREEFMQRLAPTVKQKMEREALCIQEMRECTEASQVIIKVMCNLFDELDLEDSRKV
uniref:Glycolipid transfer protein domain-containing protein n=1 Tax=Coccolithus braarudii TaxID=221442 RepID=A0A7S0L6Q5_9EUKA